MKLPADVAAEALKLAGVARAESARLDPPPSANNLFASRGGRRCRTKRYEAWRAHAFHRLRALAPPASYPCEVVVRVTSGDGFHRGRDLDNCLKPVLDALVEAGAIRNDSLVFVQRVVAEYAGHGEAGVEVTVRPIGGGA
jgi:Holliday junction resolvase RusA-like endonuclease